MRLIITFILIVAGNLAYTQCPCHPISIDSALIAYENIIGVELIAKFQHRKKFDKNQSIPKGIINKFVVLGAIKGNFEMGDTLTSLTGNGIEDDGYSFQIGRRYILFYERYIDKCTPTVELNTKLFYQLCRKMNDTIPPPPIPPAGHQSQLFKYEIESYDYMLGLRAELLNDHSEQILTELHQVIDKSESIPKNSHITIWLDENNKVVKSRIISRDPNGVRSNYTTETKLNIDVQSFIENKMRFKTVNQNCLLNRSNWWYKYY